MQNDSRRGWAILALTPFFLAPILSGCGGGGSDGGGGTTTGTNCNNGSAAYTPLTAPVSAIAAANRLSFAVKGDGTLWVWGYSNTGQMGAGATSNSVSPVKIGDGFSEVSAGVGHSLGLKSNGDLWAWGDNTYGQLGDGTTTPSNVPKLIGSNYSAISAGYNFSLGLMIDGTLWAWGNNQVNQLGDGTTTNSYVPKQIGSGFSAISAGATHALALKNDGTLWAWGANTYGQLGDGCYVDFATNTPVCPVRNNTTANSSVPEQIDGSSIYTEIAAGYQYSLAIKNDGSLWAWGNNTWFDLGDGTAAHKYVPTKIGDSGFTAISASKYSILGNFFYYHSLALKSDQTLWSWGDNTFGQLGNGTLTTGKIPAQIPNASGFIAIAAGEDDHSLAIKNDGSLWAWGSNLCGELGDGTTTSSKVPIQVSK